MQFNVFVVLLVEITNVKKQFMEKLSFERVLTNVQNAVIELREMNIRKIGGQQIEMDIWFVGDATKNFLKKFVQTVFVKFVIKLLMNTVAVILNNFFKKMKCLLCGLNCSGEKVIKKHVNHHAIKEDDIYFKDLFLPDTLEKKYDICDITFKTCRHKKYICFSFIMVQKTVWWK